MCARACLVACAVCTRACVRITPALILQHNLLVALHRFGLGEFVEASAWFEVETLENITKSE